MRRHYRSILLSAIVCLAVFANAQTPTGTIQGVVSDRTGAAIQGAIVNITKNTTNEMRQTTTDSAGRYIIPFVAPGMYTVAVEVRGFKSGKQDNVLVQVTETRPVNFKLDVGGVTQIVEVNASSESLDVDTSRDRKSVV